MADALYGPKGYYTSPRSIIGPRGDFTTTPKLTKLLAQTISEWIESAWKRQGRKLPVIELGPGDGNIGLGGYGDIDGGGYSCAFGG